MRKLENKLSALIGREAQLQELNACLSAGKNVLLEGPVGVGKTRLALEICRSEGKPVHRIDGDSRYTEQKLVGWFDPPLVLQKGFVSDSFFPGPLCEAMKQGGILFINELNRLPEGVQNVLLPAIDEGILQIPRIGEIRAEPGFRVIATQNPKEFVATSHLSEAILDRFELVSVGYQSEADEIQIVQSVLEKPHITLSQAAVRLVRATRNNPKIRRGASVRAAMSIAEIASVLMQSGATLEESVTAAAKLALPTRIEIEHEVGSELSAREETLNVIEDVLRQTEQKKKN